MSAALGEPQPAFSSGLSPALLFATLNLPMGSEKVNAPYLLDLFAPFFF